MGITLGCLPGERGSSPRRVAIIKGRLDFAFSSLVRSERKMDKSRHGRAGGCVTAMICGYGLEDVP